MKHLLKRNSFYKIISSDTVNKTNSTGELEGLTIGYSKTYKGMKTLAIVKFNNGEPKGPYRVINLETGLIIEEGFKSGIFSKFSFDIGYLNNFDKLSEFIYQNIIYGRNDSIYNFYYPTGELKIKGKYYNGKLIGPLLFYYKNHLLESKIYGVYSSENDTTFYYNIDGKIKGIVTNQHPAKI